MKAADYLRAESLDQAVAAAEQGGLVLAGGTDVMVKGRGRGVYAQRALVDVSRVPELREVRDRGDAIEIGAACTLSELCDDALLAEKLPLLADAMAHVGGVQTRNRATIGGNVVNACPASDAIPALMVLGARVRTTRRELPLADLFRDCPACLRHEGMLVRTCFYPDAAAKKTVLEQGELVRSIIVPVPAAGSRWLFHKLTRTQGIGLARISIALLGTFRDKGTGALSEKTINHVDVCMGGLFSKPWVLSAASAEEAVAVLTAKLEAESTALADYDYKHRVAPALLADAIAAWRRGETLERKRRS